MANNTFQISPRTPANRKPTMQELLTPINPGRMKL
jgi:hypothetical protein